MEVSLSKLICVNHDVYSIFHSYYINGVARCPISEWLRLRRRWAIKKIFDLSLQNGERGYMKKKMVWLYKIGLILLFTSCVSAIM